MADVLNYPEDGLGQVCFKPGDFTVSPRDQPVREVRRDLFHAGKVRLVIGVIAGQGRNDEVTAIFHQWDDIFKVVPHHQGRVDQDDHVAVALSVFVKSHLPSHPCIDLAAAASSRRCPPQAANVV